VAGISSKRTDCFNHQPSLSPLLSSLVKEDMARGEDQYESTDESDADDEVLSDDADYRSKGPKRPAAKTRETVAAGPSTNTAAAKSRKTGPSPRKLAEVKPKTFASTKDKGYAWEATYKRSWDAVREDEGGSLAGAVRGLLEASKRRRCVVDELGRSQA
jgi:transcription initiation factor TFIIH subunit 2